MFLEAILGPELGANTTWEATDAPLVGDMAELIRFQWNINKIAHYLPVYDAAFAPYRHRPIKMLEIGVSFGGSLKLWRKYFTHPDAQIVGIDYNPNCALFDDPNNNVHVRIGQQQDTQFLDQIIREFGPFDVILDDGSHIPSHTVRTFQRMFTHGLVDGGVYLVEDLHTCYSDDCPPPELDDGTPQFIDFVKILMDAMHAVYTQTPTGEEFSNSFEPNNPGRRESFQVPLATRLISSIELHDSIVVIRRQPRELPRMIRRWSRATMAVILDEGATGFLDERPHLDEADKLRRDWLS